MTELATSAPPWLLRLVATLDDAVIACDGADRIVELSAAAARLAAAEASALRGRSFADVFPAVADTAPTGAPMRRVAAPGAASNAPSDQLEVQTLEIEPGRPDAGAVHILRTANGEPDRARAAESELRAVLDTALDAIITIDQRGCVLEFNPAAEGIFGFRRDEVIGQELARFIIPEELREAHRRGLARYLATGVGVAIGKRIELPALHADGSRLEVELAITRIALPGPPVFTAYLRDIGARLRQERHRNLRLAANQVLAQASDAPSAIVGVMRAVCTMLGWEAGYFWALDRDTETLRCAHVWSLPDSVPGNFDLETRRLAMRRGEGLPGRCWESGEPAWLLHLGQVLNFPRAAAAAADGLHAGFACPVVSNGVIGVVEFFTRSLREPDLDLIETMSTVAAQLGQFVERAHAESALRASEARFRDLMEQAPFSVQIFAPDGRMLRVNRAWEDLFGVAFEQVREYDVLRDPQLERKGILPLVRRAFAGEATRIPPIEYDSQESFPGICAHAESRRWVGATIYPLKDEAGAVREVVLVHEDLSERRRTESALEDARTRLEATLEAGGIATWAWDLEANTLHADAWLAQLFGLPPRAAEGGLLDAFVAAIHPDDRARVVATLSAAVESGGDYVCEYRIVPAPGVEHWAIARGRLERAAPGRRPRMIGVLLDITARKALEQELRLHVERLAEAGRLREQLIASLAESEERLRMLADTIPQLAWTARPDGDITWYNRRWHEYTGRSLEEMQGWGWMSVHDPAVLPDVIARWKQSIATGQPFEMVFPLRAADGSYRPFLTRVEPLRDRDGQLLYWFGTNTDIGDIKRMEEALREADRRKDEFLAILAHELRNPLAPIRNALQILKLSGDDPRAVTRVRELMERQVHHLVRLVDDLLDVSRVMRGKIELRREPVDLAQVVSRAVETARPLLDAQDHALELELPAEPLVIDADPVRLGQVFGNLLTNAAKYTERGGHIALAARREGSEIVVRVRDDGIGISAEMLPAVFDMFVQADHEMTRAQGGLGIGLTLVRSLIEMHGGQVTAHSEGPGRGSEFVVRLPAGPLASEPAAAPDPAGIASTAHRRVLVVDDNRDAADSLAQLLRINGHEVRVARDGRDALVQAGSFLPDLVLLDLGMPGMNGLEVARALRSDARTRGAELVALTGWGQPADRERTAEAGFDLHLVKPIEPETLDRLLAREAGRSD